MPCTTARSGTCTRRVGTSRIATVGAAALAFGAGLTDENHLGLLKAVAYDVGSFCWPGWDEPDIEIDTDIRLFGSEAADLNVELEERLRRSAGPMAAAHWLVGAHRLAAGDRAGAAVSFETSASLARTAGDRATELLADGYVRIARRESVDTAKLSSREHCDELMQQLTTDERLYG